MADRMSRLWSPATTVFPAVLAAGGQAEVKIAPSGTLEVVQDRTIRDWTVARIIGTLQFTTVATSTWVYGVRVANENEVFGSIDPGAQQTADWMFWGAMTTSNGSYNYRDAVHIDNRSQRKSRGMESELQLYILNAGPSSGDFVAVLRTLLLVP